MLGIKKIDAINLAFIIDQVLRGCGKTTNEIAGGWCDNRTLPDQR
ncbi:hypothetical protein PL9214290081 [Planktothrix tepida PCC 9214]|uniref:Transposase n=1 Tax=Planktothrix tepida PCC 9214 TaxID=671072 RepID=A0A1J1LCT9_9CYAN|nr:hypothetical protein PL9214290081 [Planktothrix tepida PCC 9214]